MTIHTIWTINGKKKLLLKDASFFFFLINIHVFFSGLSARDASIFHAFVTWIMILLFMLRKTCRLNFTYVLLGLIVSRYVASRKKKTNGKNYSTKGEEERTATKEEKKTVIKFMCFLACRLMFVCSVVLFCFCDNLKLMQKYAFAWRISFFNLNHNLRLAMHRNFLCAHTYAHIKNPHEHTHTHTHAIATYGLSWCTTVQMNWF